MSLDELTQQACDTGLTSASIDAFCHEQKIGIAEFSERLARHVVAAYQQGSLGWSAADAVMNSFFAQANLQAGQTWPQSLPSQLTSLSTRASITRRRRISAPRKSPVPSSTLCSPSRSLTRRQSERLLVVTLHPKATSVLTSSRRSALIR